MDISIFTLRVQLKNNFPPLECICLHFIDDYYIDFGTDFLSMVQTGVSE